MKHVMYTTGKMNFIHTHGKYHTIGKSATTRVWCDEMRCYITQECREQAAWVLRKLRNRGVSIERKVVTK